MEDVKQNMLYKELHEKALEIKDKFYSNLSDKEKALINYRNLFNTIKYLIDKVELLYTITISKYGYYLDLSNLKRIDYIDIEEALNRLERSIHGEKIKKAGVI